AEPASAGSGVTEVYARASDDTPLNWDVYTPAGSPPWPAVLVIHGGNFIGGTPGDAGVAQCAQDLANAGYVAFSIAYRLAPPGLIPQQRSLGRFPDQYDDVHLAVQAARNDSRSNGKVGSVGGSAGATHTAWVAATGQPGDDRVDVGVGLSGAYDFSDFSPDSNLGYFITTVINYVGVPQTDTASLRAASPAWIVDGTVAPLFLVDSEGDLMPAVQLDDMAAQLAAHGAKNYVATRIPGVGHSFEYWPQIKNDAIAFLAAGFAPPPPTPTPSPTPSPTASPSPSPSPSLSPSPTPAPRPAASSLVNISTRAGAGTGDNVLIGGFILGNGSGSKRVIVRAIGPSLAGAGITSALADPSLQLVDATGRIIAANNDWMTSGQVQDIIATTLAPNDPKESAIVATLSAGAYTAIVTGVDGPQNIALVEVYDLSSTALPQLLNLSTRGLVGTGEGVMIAGTIISGTGPETLVLRGLGPSLATGPGAISDPLPDPILQLVNNQGTTLFTNDNWQDSQAAEITATGLAPTNPLEAAVLLDLAPGSYTALLFDPHGATGIGLLEIYKLSK
ncbi:MAG: alpha/beta hydrolase, partial [Chthoniobacterales bacterium]